jgi:hypothetical protein
VALTMRNDMIAQPLANMIAQLFANSILHGYQTIF